MLHNELGLEHEWNSDSPFSNDILMLSNHAQRTLLPVFMEQPTFEIDMGQLVNLSMCYTGDLKEVLRNEFGLEHDWNSDSPFSNNTLMPTNHA